MSTACERQDCDGTVEDDGPGNLYCDTCGLAPARKAAAGGTGTAAGAAAGPGTATGTGPEGSGRSTAGSGAAGSGRSGRSASSRPGSARSASSRSVSSRRSVSGRLTGPGSGRSSSSMSVRSTRTRSGASRGRLGAGLVSVPAVPRPDPRTAVLTNPEVPERKRFCSKCEAPVGRARGDRPGRTEGFCTKCGNPYSFSPKLHTGDIVHGQYEVMGCLAHGGLGWIYLAVDHAVDDKWVVLKGLLDTGDEDALAAAVAERRFLAQIDHPNIVGIINFVEHLDQRTGTMDGYIVMEYVGGKSLKEILEGRRSQDGKRLPLPVEQAIAYALEVLDALDYLHGRGLVYCDFKVDNVIQQEDRLKIIDLGAVRHVTDEDSAIYGTIGYQAPEVAETGPTVASDLYTVARTLAVLTFDFQGYTNVFVHSLPEPDAVEAFRQYESFFRLLVRATDPNGERRFASAGEMAEQLTGVLREVVALRTGRPHPALSTLFGPELRVVDTELVAPGGSGPRLPASLLDLDRTRRGGNGAPSVPGPGPGGPAAALPGGRAPAGSGTSGGGPAAGARTEPRAAGTTRAQVLPGQPGQAPQPGRAGQAIPDGAPSVVRLDARAAALALPVPRVDPGDPNAGFLASLVATVPSELISALQAAPLASVEKRLRELRARIEMYDLTAARATLDELEADQADDWRVVWYRGLFSLVSGDLETAALAFDGIYDAFPGEPAPKLALGVCAELLGQLDNAAEYYRLVWTTDQSYVSAAFGLARVRLASGDRIGAVQALESVPDVSIHYTAARIATVRARLRERSPEAPLRGDLLASAQQLEQLGLDSQRRETLSVEILGTALEWVASGQAGSPSWGERPGGPVPGGTSLLGSEMSEHGLRLGLERSYRVLARLAQQGRDRIELVERANLLRPRTWV